MVPVGLFGEQTTATRVRSVTAASHGFEVVGVVGAIRDSHARRAADRDETGVGLEGAPRVEHLVAGTCRRRDELGEERHRPSADDDLVG